MNDLTLKAFERAVAGELEKTAAPNIAAGLQAAKALLGRQAGAIGAGAGVGALGGGLIGGLSKGIDGYQQMKDQGMTTGGALITGVGAGLGGALSGAAVGAGLGAGAGALSGARGADLARRVTDSEGVISAFARSGQRQLHGLTGALPPGHASTRDAMQAMRGGATDALARRSDALKELRAAADVRDRPRAEKALSVLDSATKGRDYALKAEEMGLTSAPGYLKSLAKNPVDTLRTAVGAEWHGGGAGHKALMFGLPTGMAAAELAHGSKDGEGPGRVERAAKGLAHMATPLGVMPMAAHVAVGSALSRGLGVVGAGIDSKLKKGKTPKPAGPGPEADDSVAPPVQREFSNAALGKPPEGIG